MKVSQGGWREGDNGVAQLWCGPNATEGLNNLDGGSVGKWWPYKHQDLSLIFRTQAKAQPANVHCNLRGRDKQIPSTLWPSKTHLTHTYTWAHTH